MYLLDKSQQNPKEEFKYSNFPEVAVIEDQLNHFFSYVEKVNSAVSAFQTRDADKVYVNIAELETELSKSFDMTDILGRADNVCFDLLLNMRDMQENLLEILYTYRSEGDYLVSSANPVDTQSSEDQDKEMV